MTKAVGPKRLGTLTLALPVLLSGLLGTAVAYAGSAESTAKISCPTSAGRVEVASSGTMQINGVVVTPETWMTVVPGLKLKSADICIYMAKEAHGDAIQFLESMIWAQRSAKLPIHHYLCEDQAFMACAELPQQVPDKG